MDVTWDHYLNAPISPERFADCRSRCQAAFSEQRENIRQLLQATAPRTVACLGAGILNDIPYREFVRSGATLHLVDWLPGSILSGIDLSIIERTSAGDSRCLYCELGVPGPDYCQHFQRECDQETPVCDRYAPVLAAPPRCIAFSKGANPILHQADVTGGYADTFGKQILDELRGVRRWKQALAKGLGLARRSASQHVPLDIASYSIDLVTSSMLLSQFEHEPYGYFARRVVDQLGPPPPREEADLRHMGEELSRLLLINQVERHCREIERLLAPGGHCYLSFELFSRLEETGGWFIVAGMSQALEIVGRHFLIRFDLLPQKAWLGNFQSDGPLSLVCALVLQAKGPQTEAAKQQN